MAVNESLISIPSDFSDPKDVENSFVSLVEQIDIISGSRGGDGYVKRSEFDALKEDFDKLKIQLDNLGGI